MKFFKYIVISIVGIMIINFLISSYLLYVYFNGLNRIRKTNSIELINSYLIKNKELNTYIFSNTDTLSPFLYKMIDIDRGFFFTPKIVSEADIYGYGEKMNEAELMYVYYWNYKFFKPTVNNRIIRYTYVSKEINLPDGSLSYIKKSIYLTKIEADSILNNWY